MYQPPNNNQPNNNNQPSFYGEPTTPQYAFQPPPPPNFQPTPPPAKGFLALLTLTLAYPVGFALTANEATKNVGPAIILACLCCVLFLDWSGFVSMFRPGMKYRTLLIVLAILFSPISLPIYLVRAWMARGRHPAKIWPASAPKTKKQMRFGCVGSLALLVVFAIFGTAASADPTTAQGFATPTVQQLGVNQPAATLPPTVAPTQPPTPTAKPTEAPTPIPTQPPIPTQAPTQPVKTGVNGNPWGFDFVQGKVITDPPGEFCGYFNCIASFWTGEGYVVECANGQFSKSGGKQGVCSKQGGYKRTLYSH